MSRLVVIAAVMIAVAGPALAAEYYVAQDPTTQKCKIVEEKPVGKTMVMIGTASYPTKEEAKAGKKAATECHQKKTESN